MTIDEYIAVFRDECSTLQWEEICDLNAVFARRAPIEIFLAMEELKAAKKRTTARFDETLTNFYGQFC